MSQDFKLKTKGLTVNIRVKGSGPALLFLGGSNFDLSINAPIFDSALVQHFKVAAADPRGLGGTDAPDGQWTMHDFAQDALDILDALGWQTVYLVGESFGAMTALHLAALAPHRIIGLSLVAGAAGGEGGSSYPIHRLRDIEDLNVRARTALEIMDERFISLIENDPERANGRIKARVKSDKTFLNNSQNAVGYPKLLAARASHNAWDLLPNISTPALVFAGRYDQQAPIDRAKKIVQAMPNACLHIIEGGHNICFETPLIVSIIIENWTKQRNISQ